MQVKLAPLAPGGSRGILRRGDQNIMQSVNAVKKDVDKNMSKEARFAKTGHYK